MDMMTDGGGQTGSSAIRVKYSAQLLVSNITMLFRRRWRYVGIPPVVVSVAVFVGLLFVQPVYKSTAEVLLVDPATQSLGMADRSFTITADSATVESSISLLSSLDLALRVVRETHLDADPEFKDPTFSGDPARQLVLSAEKFRKRIEVTRPHPYVLAVSVTSNSAQKAQTLAQAVAQQFLDDERDVRNVTLRQLKGFWTQRLDVPDVGGRIISAASLPQSPSSPRKTLIVAVAAILATLLGGVAGVTREMLDGSLRTVLATEDLTGCQVLGMVPLLGGGDEGMDHRSLVSQLVRAPFSQLAQTVHSINALLQLNGFEGGKRAVLLTSALPGEGKSASAMLVAASAASKGEKVVLVDLDFRHPTVSSCFTSSRRLGWEDVLSGGASVDDVILTDLETGIDIVPSRRDAVHDGPPAGGKLQYFVGQLKQRYDLVILDAAPVLASLDAIALLSLVDYTVLVVEWGQTPIDKVVAALKSIFPPPENRDRCSVILNKVNYSEMRNYDGAIASYGYYQQNAPALYDGW